MTKVTCPFCGSSSVVDVDLTAGQHLVCPYCENRFTYGEEVTTGGKVTNTQLQSLVNVSCPHCGTQYEVQQSECGAVAICQVCNKEFVVGQRESASKTQRLKQKVKFCAKCGMKMPMDALFCPRCGGKVIDANGQTANGSQVEAQNSPATGKLQKLFSMIVWVPILDGISLLISLFDVRDYYVSGRMGTFVFGVAFIGLGVWLCVAIRQLKSWARKTHIILTLICVLLYMCGFKGVSDGNPLVTVLDFASLLIAIYCMCLCFAKEVVLAFEPDSKLIDARAVVNTIHCIGYWAAFCLLLVVGFMWCAHHHETEEWEMDCTNAAVAGSSSARNDLMGPYTGTSYFFDSGFARERSGIGGSKSSVYDKTPPGALFLGYKLLCKIILGIAALLGGIFSQKK